MRRRFWSGKERTMRFSLLLVLLVLDHWGDRLFNRNSWRNR